MLVRHADPHQLVPCRMKLNLIYAVAKAVVSAQSGRMAVRQVTYTQGLSAPHQRPEFTDSFFCPVAAFSSQSISQRHVIGEEVVIFERWRLIEDLAGFTISRPGLRHHRSCKSGSPLSAARNIGGISIGFPFAMTTTVIVPSIASSSSASKT